MASVNSWNQKQVPLPIDTTSLPPLCVPIPTVPNWKGGSVPFQQCPLSRSKFNIIQDLHSQNHQMLKTESNMNRSSLSVTHHLPGSQTRTIQGLHPPAYNLFLNGTNVTQNSNLLQHQLHSSTKSVIRVHPLPDQMLMNQSNETAYLQHQQQSSKDAQVIQNFHSVTHQLLSNESNISQQSSSLRGQLPSNGISPNLNVFNQLLPVNSSQFKYLLPRVPFSSEFIRNQEKYQSDQQSERESIMRHSTDRLGMTQNRCIPIQQRAGNQDSYPLTTNVPKMGFNLNREPSIPTVSLPQNLYPQYSSLPNMNLPQNLYPQYSSTSMNLPQTLYSQYSEKVHICVIGPPGCGKADLIRTFGTNDNIRIPPNKQLIMVSQQGLVSFGTTFTIDIWYADDLTSAADDLRSLCQSSKSAIVLVYSIAQDRTLLNVLEWIRVLKSDIAINVPILLVGNTTGVDSQITSGEIMTNGVRFSDGVRAKEEYDLSEYYEFSTRCVKDADTIFLIAAFKAFSRMMQKSVIKPLVLAP